MKKRALIILSVLFLGFFAVTTHAQLQNGDILISISPSSPNPNTNTKVSLSTYSTDLNKTKISWYLDGNLASEGIGRKNFSFTTKAAGTSSTVEAIIETSSGDLIKKQVVITPSSVDILWEAKNSYVPPFYKGKKLGTNEGLFKINAIPNSSSIVGNFYDWKLDNSPDQNSSGYEKNYFEFQKSYLDVNNKIDVIITDLFGKKIGEGNITVGTNSPKILLYEKDQVLGIKWEAALDDGFKISKTGNTIFAAPFYFSTNTNQSNLSYEWYIGKEKTESSNNLLSVKPADRNSGTSIIKVAINNINSLFQNMEKTLNVNF